ncbi:BTB/POZ protein [Rhizophagus irregularis DAOM 181602=DAOM 197198]|nr:BTB/POZ protein [Rhizophagus irregularis DAOM 181602=DAOM 197198]
MVDNKFLPELSENLLEILDENQHYDIIIEVGNDPHIRKFRAHTLILNYRSPYFREILSTDKKKSKSDEHIKLPNISPEIFQIILRYIYGGKLSFGECNDSADIINVLVAASELKLRGLINHLQSILIENNSNWVEQNFNLVYRTSFEDDSFSELQNHCNDLMFKEPDKIFNSLGFPSIPEEGLISLVKSDNLQMKETQVWEYVLKWGLAQNPELPADYSNNPSGKSKPRNNIGSKIITNRHVELILKWIDKLEITDKLTSSYDFKLMISGSRDGLSNNKFHEVCVNQPRTITVVKVKGINKILGGYNPIGWNSAIGGYSNTNESFIFSFENSINSNENYVLSRVADENHAIWNNHYYGPSFGNYDLILEGNNFCASYCRKGVYKSLIWETSELFSVEDYEVFQITKN